MLDWWKRSGCQTSFLFTPSVLSFMTPPWKTSCSESIQMEIFFTVSGNTWSHFPETRCFYKNCESSDCPEAFPCVYRVHKKENKMFSALKVHFSAEDSLFKYEKSVIIKFPWRLYFFWWTHISQQFIVTSALKRRKTKSSEVIQELCVRNILWSQ